MIIFRVIWRDLISLSLRALEAEFKIKKLCCVYGSPALSEPSQVLNSLTFFILNKFNQFNVFFLAGGETRNVRDGNDRINGFGGSTIGGFVVRRWQRWFRQCEFIATGRGTKSDVATSPRRTQSQHKVSITEQSSSEQWDVVKKFCSTKCRF